MLLVFAQVTFLGIGAILCLSTLFAGVSLQKSQFSGPTFSLLAFYAWPSLYYCLE